MKHYVLHDGEGRIVQYGSCPDDALALQEYGGFTLLEGTGRDASQYVHAGIITARPANPAVLKDTMLLNLVQPCVIVINDTPYPCLDASAELAFTYPGIYRVRVECFPYLDAHFEMEKA
ncbi:hypothetical protein AAKU55_005551 [Oxalobacteraceae bacterium GrIS 1.11]